jgi:hypothetical protein
MNGPMMASQMASYDDAPSATLSLLLGRVKIELDSLTRIVGEMQSGLSPLLVDASLEDPEKCRHAQNLDLVWQTLESLALVVDGAACEKASDQDINIDAIADALPLADLAARLRGRIKPPQSFGNDLDLF